jgi:hypothetical protein
MHHVAVLLVPAYSLLVLFSSFLYFFFFFANFLFAVQSLRSLTTLFAYGRAAILSLWGLPRPNH